MTGNRYDIFLSYHRKASSGLARALHDALVARGVTVFLDEAEIEDFASITARIEAGLAGSKALLAIYSATYPQRRACQFELTAALLAAMREGDPLRRVLLVNPEPGFDHIEPIILRDEHSPRISDEADVDAIAEVADSTTRHVGNVNGTLGEITQVVAPTWYGLHPAASQYFVGRFVSMWAIYSALHSGDWQPLTGAVGPGIAQIVGLAGIGKTLLAEEYALRFGPAYPGGVFWLTARGAGATEAERNAERAGQFRLIANQLGVALEGLSDPDIEAALRADLGRRDSVLWIVDDLPSGLSADEYRRWCVPQTSGRTLFTTQSRAYGALARTVELGQLNPVEAYELLTSRRSPAGAWEETAARELAADLAYHPLALEIARAGVLYEAGDSPFTSFRAALAHPGTDELEAAATLADALPTGHEPSIATTLRRSIGALGPEGRDLLRIASVVGPAPIPALFADAVLQRADGLDDATVRRRGMTARADLHRSSLAELSDRLDGFLVHGLVSRTMRLSDDEPLRRELLRYAAIAVLLDWLPSTGDRRFGPDMEPLIPLARELAANPKDEEEAELLHRVARHDLERGAYASATVLYKRESAVLLDLLGPEHPKTLIAMGDVGSALHAQGNLREARTIKERVVEARIRNLGPEDPDSLLASSNLATTLRDQGELAAARGVQEKVLATRLRLLGPEHADTLLAMSNLATTLHAQGQLADAKELQEAVFATRRRLLGAEDPDTLIAMDNLASTLHAQGDLAGARELSEAVLAAFRRVLGPDHPDTLIASDNLTALLVAQGELPQARELSETVLAAFRRVLGSDHFHTLTAMGNLAGVLEAQGDLDQARQLEEAVVDTRSRILGVEHPDTLTAMANLAAILRALGELQQAREIEERVLEAREVILGADHPDTLAVLSSLTWTTRAQGDLIRARAVGERLVEASRRVLGPEHPNTLAAMANLAVILHTLGEIEPGRELEEAVLDASTRILGPEHENTLTAAGNLAMTLHDLGNFERARLLQDQVLDTTVRTLGFEHPLAVMAMDHLALTLYAQGNFGRAASLADAVLSSRQRTLGPEHPDTLRAMANLATSLHASGQADRACQLIAETAETSLRVLGPDDARTEAVLSAQRNMACGEAEQ